MMITRKIFLIMLVILGGLTVDRLDAARSKFKNPQNNVQLEENIQVTQVNNNKLEDDQNLEIDTQHEEDAGGLVEPMVIKSEEPKQMIQGDELDIQAKRKAVVSLVERGVKYLKENDASHAFGKFTHTNDFMHGELYLFVFDASGVCLAHGQQNDLLWKNLIDQRDAFGAPIVKSFIEKAKKGGGWITYNWRNATKISYVQLVKKEEKEDKDSKSQVKEYIIGAGYYPHSKVDSVVNLVKGAVALFNDVKAQKRPKEEAFSAFNYSMGRFVYGDLTLNAIDFKGTLFAQGNRPGLIGTNSWNYKDSQGKFINQEIVKKLQETPEEGIWVEYTAHRAPKRAYAERVVDDKGVHYAIFCGYYPDSNREQVVDLVKKGFQYMKSTGKSVAAEAFTDKKNDTYKYGDLNLLVYDFDGVVVADGADPEHVGQKHFDDKDEDGRYYVRELIAKAKDGGGWVDVKVKNSFESIYVEEVDLGLAKYAICCGTFPISKTETMELLVKSAASYLETNVPETTFQEFTKPTGDFIRGDLSVFVFDPTGLCYAYGDEYDLIWQNLMSAKDDSGKSIAQLFIESVDKGAVKIPYVVNKVPKIAFVDKVEKEGKTYIIGSSFYK